MKMTSKQTLFVKDDVVCFIFNELNYEATMCRTHFSSYKVYMLKNVKLINGGNQMEKATIKSRFITNIKKIHDEQPIEPIDHKNEEQPIEPTGNVIDEQPIEPINIINDEQPIEPVKIINDGTQIEAISNIVDEITNSLISNANERHFENILRGMKVSRDHVCDKSKIIKDFKNKKITFFEARLKIKQIQRDEQKDENIGILRRIIKKFSSLHTNDKQLKTNRIEFKSEYDERNSIIDSYKNDEITFKDACKMLQNLRDRKKEEPIHENKNIIEVQPEEPINNIIEVQTEQHEELKDEQQIEPINEIKLFVPYNLIENKLKENEDKNVKRLMGINVEREFEKEKEEIIKSLKDGKTVYLNALHLIRKMSIKERSGILTRLHVNKIQEPHKQNIILDFKKKRITFTEATTRIKAFIDENIEYFKGYIVTLFEDEEIGNNRVRNLRHDKDKVLRQYTNSYITYGDAINELNRMEYRNEDFYSRNPLFDGLQYKCEKLRDKFYEKHGYGCDHEIIHDYYNSKITYEEAKTRLNLT
jgi:hypothetical protein